MHFYRVLLCSCLFCSYAFVANAEAPYIDPADDQEHFGSPDDVLFWAPEQ